MSLRTEAPPAVRPVGPLAVELGLVTAMLAGLYLWRRVVAGAFSILFGPPPAFGDLLVDGLVAGVPFVAGVVLFAGVYAAARDVEVGPALPSPAGLPAVALAAASPAALVAVVALVGSRTGVPYGSLTGTSVAGDAPLFPVVAVAGLGLLVAVPVLVATCQVLVQRSFGRHLGSDATVLATTAMTGFAMVSTTGRLGPVPDAGKLVGVALFAFLLGAGVYADERVDRARLRPLSYAPLALFVAVVLGSGVASVDSVAGGLFALTQLATVGVAAYGYDRTDSLLAPALAYASLLAANRAVVVLEAGVLP